MTYLQIKSNTTNCPGDNIALLLDLCVERTHSGGGSGSRVFLHSHHFTKVINR